MYDDYLAIKGTPAHHFCLPVTSSFYWSRACKNSPSVSFLDGHQDGSAFFTHHLQKLSGKLRVEIVGGDLRLIDCPSQKYLGFGCNNGWSPSSRATQVN